MLLDDRVSRLVHEVYEAAENPDAWQIVLQTVAELFEAPMVSLLEHRPTDGPDWVPYSVGLDPAFVSSYQKHYSKCNIYLEHALPILREGVVLPHQAYCEDAEILSSEYYNDFQRRLGLFHVTAGVVSVAQGRFLMLTINRSRYQRPFSPEELDKLEFLVPHVQRAWRIGKRVRDGGGAAVDPAILRKTFALTATEASFAALLATGHSTAQICVQLRIRISTARTHLRHLFQKTGTQRQPELVARLLKGCRADSQV
ncbi:MAG: helix-turn-helix transcriptional regulator [Bryobacteraceae bacterium]|nr:helix-turn-helix transcriptional regulator [Bryobacteraceae bacterium]